MDGFYPDPFSRTDLSALALEQCFHKNDAPFPNPHLSLYFFVNLRILNEIYVWPLNISVLINIALSNKTSH